MGKRIRGENEYRAFFPDAKKRRHAYKLAWNNRKFEIRLYWKRATYFWTLIAATFTGYFLLSKNPSNGKSKFLAACIGLLLSISWYLVNRGSKYWQENWERHVDSLEDEFSGPLYKVTISKELFRWWKFWDGYPFSVSKINQLASLFVVFIWVGLAVASFPHPLLTPRQIALEPYALAAVTILFVGLLIWFGRTRGKDRVLDFYMNELTPSGSSNEFTTMGDSGTPGRSNAMSIRDRLKDLNAKAYYLLVALSFIYRASPARSLRVAFTLTAIVAILPVQDYVESTCALTTVRWLKVGFLTLALVSTLWWVWLVKT